MMDWCFNYALGFIFGVCVFFLIFLIVAVSVDVSNGEDFTRSYIKKTCIEETGTVYVSTPEGGLSILITESGDIATCDILKK